MAKNFTTIVDQFGSANGKRQNKPHNMCAVREPKDANNTKGNLFVLVEVRGSISQIELVEKQLTALIRDSYYLAKGGITAGLRRAVQTANQWLYQHNVKQDKDLIGGVVAIILRDEDLFVAQNGPAALYTCLTNFVRRHPQESVWLDEEMPQFSQDTTALGLRPFVEPYIAHLQIQPDDMFLLADSRLTAQLPSQRIGHLLQTKDVNLMSKNIMQHASNGYSSALIVKIAEESRPAQGISNPKEVISASVSKIAAPSKEKMFAFSMPTLMQRSDKPERDNKSKPEPGYEAPSPYQADFYEADEYEEEIYYTTAQTSPLNAIWKTATAVVVGAIAFLGSGLHTILSLVLPGSASEDKTRQAGRQAKALSAKKPSRRALLYVALVIPLTALLITAGMYWYKGYARENDYQAALEMAQQKYHEAQSAAPDSARILLNETEAYLAEASAIKPEQQEIHSLLTLVEEQRDTINGVERLYYVPELQQYPDPGVLPQQVVVQGTNVYVMDAGLNRVFHHTLNGLDDALLPDEQSPVLLEQGQEVGNAVVKQLVDMIWMPAGGGRQTSDLLVLQTDGLIELDPDWGPTNLTINGYQNWINPVAAGSYYGNFYLLDEGANDLYRYFPTINGYENPPESYFAPDTRVNLTGAVDMAIDGAIYILYRDGRIEKYLSGQPAVFQITGLDMPFNNPVAIFTEPDETTQFLYVADAGNNRIVQLTKEGQFVRQLKPRPGEGIAFDGLHSLYVDELAEKMYILNNNSLLAPNLPAK